MILIGILYVEAISFTAPEKKTRLKANSERWFDMKLGVYLKTDRITLEPLKYIFRK